MTTTMILDVIVMMMTMIVTMNIMVMDEMVDLVFFPG